jgi:hypothetical protein
MISQILSPPWAPQQQQVTIFTTKNRHVSSLRVD